MDYEKYTSNEEAENTKVSRYNSAALINLRISNLFENANRVAVDGNYNKWNYYLDRIWLELSGDATGDEKKEFYRLTLSIPTNNLVVKPFNNPKKDFLLLKSKQYVALMNKEEFLRKLQNKQGKGTAYDMEDDDFD